MLGALPTGSMKECPMSLCKTVFALVLTSLLVQPVQAQTPPPEMPSSGVSAVSADYLIGPGDTLQIFVWQNPELSVTVPVRPDGRISTPLVEDTLAVGKTPVQLATDLETALAVFIRTPKVSVIVSQAVGALSQVQVIGQVTRPSGVPYRAGLRVLDALLAVEGLSEFAAPNRAMLIRTENGKETKTRIRIGDLLDSGDLEQNLLLQPGDVIVIPQTWF
ncbi:MAG: sugar ABC transporter substrate-binding protein [Gammaproteobacteria bacterium]|nr:sugar ABC transporter substrate-binding protein [Gammaproteobacteria bacterium]